MSLTGVNIARHHDEFRMAEQGSERRGLLNVLQLSRVDFMRE